MTLTARSSTCSPKLLARAEFATQALSRAHPPRFVDSHKALIHSLACPEGMTPGNIEASRWEALPLQPELPSHEVRLSARPARFEYGPTPEGAIDWHVNFADAELFYGYGVGLFAQDELQVAEHPILASLREALVAAPVPGFLPLTTVGVEATPVLVMGAPRNCAIASRVGEQSIYGSNARKADTDTIRQAVKRLDPPTVTHVLAIEAIPGGRGHYTLEQLLRTTVTATTGFAAARLESERTCPPGTRVVIHSGHWGCGAFGGNRRVMALLQLVAARLAGIDELVFHSFDPSGMRAFEQARGHFERLTGASQNVEQILGGIHELGFEWGNSDGN